MKKTKMTRKESTKPATVRLPFKMHRDLKIALIERDDTLLDMVVRAAARYLDEHEGKTADRQRFLDTASAFFRVADRGMMNGIRLAMEDAINKPER